MRSGGEDSCGYLKSSGGQPWKWEQGGVMVGNNRGWSTFVQANFLPPSLGGTWGAGAAAAVTSAVNGGGRPAGCVGNGNICCYKFGNKYNT
jgi:hypothetical protein